MFISQMKNCWFARRSTVHHPTMTNVCIVQSFVCFAHSPADSVDEAQKWLIGLELLRQETLMASTPVLIER